MKIFRLILFTLFITLVITSCTSIKPLEYRGHSDFTIANLTGNPTIKTDIQLYNPNKSGIKLKSTDITVFVNAKELGNVLLTEPVKIKGQSTFTLPFIFTTSYPKLAAVAISDLGGFLKGDDVPYSVDGYFIVQKFLYKKKIPFTFDDKVQKANLKF